MRSVEPGSCLGRSAYFVICRIMIGVAIKARRVQAVTLRIFFLCTGFYPELFCRPLINIPHHGTVLKIYNLGGSGSASRAPTFSPLFCCNRTLLDLFFVPVSPPLHIFPEADSAEIDPPAFCEDTEESKAGYPNRQDQPTQTVPSDDSGRALAPCLYLQATQSLLPTFGTPRCR